MRLAKVWIARASEHICEYISGKKTRVRTLRSTGITLETEREITGIYDEICTLSERHRIELDMLWELALFSLRGAAISRVFRAAE